jgi:hypothetical protein
MAMSYTFLPWVRQGVVSAIQAKDTAGAQLRSRVKINVVAHLKDDPNPDTSVAVRVHGPGDVTGFDARQVIRTEPQHLTSDFEPNYFPFVEFDRPDFPWIFTPAKSNDNEQLRPWICLVVVEKREANLKVDLTRPLPILRANAKTELPDLSEAWAWAHAQVSGGTFLFSVDLKYQTDLDEGTLPDDLRKEFQGEGIELSQNITVEAKEAGSRWELWDKDDKRAYLVNKGNNTLNIYGGTSADVNNALANNPELTLSRLLAPRKLQPNTSYYACVVPTFEVGRKAGLGEDIKDSQGQTDEFLKPAWDTSMGEIDLPVYYHWEFSTGAAGDFESLVWLLQRKQLTFQEVGTRDVQVNNPDLDNPWPEVEGFEKILLEGALRAYQSQTQNRDDPLKPLQDSEDYKNFQEKLRALLNKPEDPKSIVTLPPSIPIAPPIYGRWHAAQKTIPEKTISNGARDVAWLRELNLNPSHRAVASIGTQIVQDQQEQLMASAWEQVGEIEKANQILRQAQLALTAAATIYQQHLAVLAEETFFVMTSQVHSRTLIDPQLVLNPAPTGMVNAKTTFAITGTSRVPQTLTEGTFRRLTRSRGRLARRLKPYGGLRSGRLLQRLNDGEIQVVPKRLPPHGMVTMEQLLRRFERLDRFCAEQVRHRLDTEFEVIRSTLPPPENISNDLNPILTQLNQLLTSEILSLEARKHLERAQRALMKSQGLLRRLPPPLSLDALQELMHLFSAARDVLTEAMRILSGSAFLSVDEIRSSLDRIFPPKQIQRLLFGIAIYAHQREMEPCEAPVPQPKPKLNLLAIKTALLKQLNPEKTITARIKSRIVAPSYWNLDTRFEAIMAAPEFPSPMYRPLAEFSQDLILPGLSMFRPT